MNEEAGVRVMIVDDHTMVRAGIRSLLEKQAAIQVVADTGDSTRVLDMVAQHTPDLILLDIAMPGINGIDLTERIAAKYPGTRIIILSMHDQVEYVLRALRAGAAGYLLKDSAVAELGFAIRAVRKGETFLSPAVSSLVVDQVIRPSEDDERDSDPLTLRQREILALIAQGQATKEIAYQLNISAKTVESHRAQIMARLDIHDVPGLVRYAIRMGLISTNE